MNRYLLFVSQAYALPILRPLQEAIRARGDLAAWYMHDIDETLLRPDEKVLRSVEEVKDCNPVAVFVPTNWVPDFFPGVKVEVFHGLANDATGKKGHYRIRGFFDLYCTHAPEGTELFSALARRHGTFHVTETGWPKVDPLFQHRDVDVRRYRPGLDKPVVLYASTFSPSLTSAPALLDTIKRLSQQDQWHWLVTMHPKQDASLVAEYRALQGPNLQFVDVQEDPLPVLQAADVMLCDTSSIAMEFMLLDKPVVTFRTKVPGPHYINTLETGEIAPAINRALSRPEALMSSSRRFIDSLHPYRDGNSSERVLAATDEFIERYAGRLKQKPVNLWRKLRIRRQMRYWRLR